MTAETGAPPGMSAWERRLVVGADRFIYWLTAHWLLVFSAAIALFLALPILSPLLVAWGQEGLGGAIFRGYRLVCHQRPERSFFILGEQMAFCQRDAGVYAGLLLGGVLFALSGRRGGIRNLRLYLWLFVLPVFIDGMTQLAGLRASNWMLRLGTGTWFGVGTAFFAYPVIAAAMSDTRKELESRFGVGLERLGRDAAPSP